MIASYLTWLLLYLRRHEAITLQVVALCRDRQKAERYFSEFLGEPYFQLLLQDVCDPIAYEGRADVIFHLAGNASPYHIVNDPVGIMKCNLLGTINIMELARAKQTERVIFASTREVYGEQKDAERLDERSSILRMPSSACSPYSLGASLTSPITWPMRQSLLRSRHSPTGLLPFDLA